MLAMIKVEYTDNIHIFKFILDQSRITAVMNKSEAEKDKMKAEKLLDKVNL